MKTLKSLSISVFILLIFGCNSREKGIDNLVGGWGYSGDSLLLITKQDTTILGVLQRSTKTDGADYSNGRVLFKDFTKLSDTTYTAKGLFMKPIYRTEKVFVQSYYYHIPDRYEERQVFDHMESMYVDYRLQISRNVFFEHWEYNLSSLNIVCSKLTCVPFSEGPTWEFYGKLTPGQVELIDKEVIRISDSIRMADSLEKVQSEQKRINAIEEEKAKKAKELLK